MRSADIRGRFQGFFEERGHLRVPSAPLVPPAGDRSVLLTTAGMQPLIPYFLGQQEPPARLLTSCQKCFRTVDIDEVGLTARHLTFFEMLGNFSVGEYFKQTAVELAWELSLEGFGLSAQDIWITVFAGDELLGLGPDEEAIEAWRSVGIPRERIVLCPRSENFWQAGPTGPSGPCSELYFDRGPAYGGPQDLPGGENERFVEYWNLVFMQYDQNPPDHLTPLPARNIDTGLGLERLASVLQGVDNLYEIDEVFPVLDKAAEMTGKTYGQNPSHVASESHPDDVRLRVVADHVRTSLMLIGDGVTPGNEGRGYVLRRMLRRAIRSMRLLGWQDAPSLPVLLPVSMARMSQSYPELRTDFARISQVAYAEEEAFRRTLASGTTILDTAVSRIPSDPAQGAREMSGAQAFALHDTYGFPIDLTLEMAAEQGVSVDEPGFRRLMAEQRNRAKADATSKKSAHGDTAVYRRVADALGRDVEFTGYDEVVSEGRVRGIIRDGANVDAAGTGDAIELVLDRTPFYAEGGGQLADGGRVELANGAVLEVRDVQKPISGLIVHRATVVFGEVTTGDVANAEVDIERRRSISRAHTATHMVHKAIREALGETATQAGSENAPGRFRFDFTAQQALAPSVLSDVETRVNALLLEDLPVQAEVMTQEQARSLGAMALFGEKYGDAVRVVSVGDWAKELCGGTHAQRSGQLGIVKLLGESSIGSGVRRVEALVGADAYSFLAREHAIVGQLSEVLKVRSEELPERVSGILSRLRDAEREIAGARREKALAGAARLVDTARDIGGVTFVSHDADALAADDLRSLVLDVRSRLGNERSTVVAMAAAANGRPVVIAATNAAARDVGVKAGDLVRQAARALGGGGGGKDDLAQGGGTDPAKVSEALGAIEGVLRERHG